MIVLGPILLNSHPGTKYGIPFPVFARAAYGTTGSNLPALLRALVACGWFGINAWIGGAALQTFFTALWPGWGELLGTTTPSWSGHPFQTTQWIAFGLFWALNVLVIFRGMELLRKVERWAAPYVLVMTALLVWWAVSHAGGLGPIIKQTAFTGSESFSTVFVSSLTGTIAFWSTLSLNMPDFTRFGRSQREQAIGQVVALPSTMTVFAAMGIAITSATAVIYGAPIWDPIALGGMFHNKLIVAIAMFTVVVATLAVNIAANTVSPGERLRERVAQAHRLQARRPDHGRHRRRDDAVAAARESGALHRQLARRLWRGARLGRRRAHRRLLDLAQADARSALALRCRRRRIATRTAGTYPP